MTTASTAPVVIEQSERDGRATEVQVPMRDGTLLASDVYLPGPGLGPVPTVLIRLPYDKTGRYTFIPQIGAHFTAHGFAVVAQDVRGKYRSGGKRDPFVNEANDGYDTVEWIIAQPWSDGSVGTWGDSYYGFTQWALASTGHPAHKAMVPRVTGHRFFDMSPGGGMTTLTLLDWLVDAWSIQELVVEGSTDHATIPAIDMVHPSLDAGDALLRGYLERLADPEAMMHAIFPTGNPASSLRIPALHTGGWFDNLQFWQLDDWNSALGSPAAEHQYLVMWSSDHEDYRWRPDGTPAADDFGLDRDALARHIPALLELPISFFDHYLRGGDGRWSSPRVRYELCGVGERDASTWPPRSVVERRLHPTPAGTLVADPSTGEVAWRHDPADPVPFLIESEWDQNRGGLPDESALAARDDTVVFESAAAEEPWNLIGRCTFSAAVAAETERTFVVARLYDVAPDGDTRFILGNATDVVADGVTRFTIRLGDTAYRMRAGHRLRLQISTSLAGQYPVHPGTDEPVWSATVRRAATQALILDGAALDYGEDQD